MFKAIKELLCGVEGDRAHGLRNRIFGRGRVGGLRKALNKTHPGIKNCHIDQVVVSRLKSDFKGWSVFGDDDGQFIHDWDMCTHIEIVMSAIEFMMRGGSHWESRQRTVDDVLEGVEVGVLLSFKPYDQGLESGFYEGYLFTRKK